ncbi:uncharacterized protein PRCAT00006211001 [Priceomyces carsonii]|uniref:uncharacterized protein n=1 Tax=Priceomyces carsonii TaxID=28549 RepID=UPI002ED91267|nr:unnamed protein product [Priceomyces carsonii]
MGQNDENKNDSYPIVGNDLKLSQEGNQQPLFHIEQVQLQFSLDYTLKQLLVRSNVMYLISKRIIYKIKLDNPTEVYKVNVTGTSEEITKCWLHPSGLHLIVQTYENNYYYLHDSYRELKPLPRLKGLSVKFIAFFDNHDGATTGDFLLATEDSIYLAMIKSHTSAGQENKRDDKYVKQVYKKLHNISGLAFCNNNSQIVLFSDSSVHFWDCFDTSYSELTRVFKTTPKSLDLSSSDGPSVFESNGQEYLFTFLKSKEIYTNDPEILLSKTEKLNVTEQISGSIVISDHHIIALNDKRNKLLVMNKLSKKEITLNLNDLLGTDISVLAITADYKAKTYWVYSNSDIYELVIENESVSVWYNYYVMGKYDEALKCLEKKGTSFQKDMVLIKQGYDYLQRGGFALGLIEDTLSRDLTNLQIKGIKTLAHLSEPFEKVCLMLLNLQSSDANAKGGIISDKLLIEYLLVKFKIARDVEKNRIRIIILSSWIIERMLRVMYRLQNEVEHKLMDEPKSSVEYKKSTLADLNNQFMSFLKSNYKILDKKTIYSIIEELYYYPKLIYYAELIGDFEFILNYYINLEQWPEAIKTMIRIYTNDTTSDIIYKVSTVLLINSPKATVNAWLKFNSLDYEKLLPAIFTYNKNSSSISLSNNETIYFLLKLIHEKGINNSYVNNCYLSMLITYPATDSISKKIANKHINKFFNFAKLEFPKKDLLYDSNLILRLCLRYNHFQPAILVLINDMAQFEQALKLALDNDLVQLGEFVLRSYNKYLSDERNGNQEDDFDSRYIGKIKLDEESFGNKKKLWLMFAKYLIEGAYAGKSFDIILGKPQTGKEEPEINGKEESSNKNGTSIEKVSEEIAGVDVESKKSNYRLKELNRVLTFLLNSSDINYLTLKDLLPLFPESININNFQHEIVKSLNDYNSKIGQLSMEMNESLQISLKLKHQIYIGQTIEEKGKLLTIIEPGEPCKLCNNLLVSKNFICFKNCHHNFHKSCLIKFYLGINYKFKSIFETFKRSPSSLNRNELDDILLKECVLCNESNINLIDYNLIDVKADVNELKQWDL